MSDMSICSPPPLRLLWPHKAGGNTRPLTKKQLLEAFNWDHGALALQQSLTLFSRLSGSDQSINLPRKPTDAISALGSDAIQLELDPRTDAATEIVAMASRTEMLALLRSKVGYVAGQGQANISVDLEYGAALGTLLSMQELSEPLVQLVHAELAHIKEGAERRSNGSRDGAQTLGADGCSARSIQGNITKGAAVRSAAARAAADTRDPMMKEAVCQRGTVGCNAGSRQSGGGRPKCHAKACDLAYRQLAQQQGITTTELSQRKRNQNNVLCCSRCLQVIAVARGGSGRASHGVGRCPVAEQQQRPRPIIRKNHDVIRISPQQQEQRLILQQIQQQQEQRQHNQRHECIDLISSSDDEDPKDPNDD